MAPKSTRASSVDPPKPPRELVEARELVAELEADRMRLSEIVASAADRLRQARKGPEETMREAAREVAGLKEALEDVDADLHVARENLKPLERAHHELALRVAHDAAVANAASAHDAVYQAAGALVDTFEEASGRLREALQWYERAAHEAEARARDIGSSYAPPTPAEARPFLSRVTSPALGYALADAMRLPTGARTRMSAQESREADEKRRSDREEATRSFRARALRELLQQNLAVLQAGRPLHDENIRDCRAYAAALVTLGESLDDLDLPADWRPAEAA